MTLAPGNGHYPGRFISFHATHTVAHGAPFLPSPPPPNSSRAGNVKSNLNPKSGSCGARPKYGISNETAANEWSARARLLALVNLLIIPYSLHLAHFRLKQDIFYSGPGRGRGCLREHIFFVVSGAARRAPLHGPPRPRRPPPSSLPPRHLWFCNCKARLTLFSSKKISLVRLRIATSSSACMSKTIHTVY